MLLLRSLPTCCCDRVSTGSWHANSAKNDATAASLIIFKCRLVSRPLLLGIEVRGLSAAKAS